MSSKPYRVRWEVAPYAALGGLLGWKVTVRRAPKPAKAEIEAIFPKQAQAMHYAVDSCNFWAKKTGERSELRVKSRLGRVRDSRTYLFDPPGNG